jgi:hypothetical protein
MTDEYALIRARILLADDPDEMDEEWLARIISQEWAEAVMLERHRIARRVSERTILRLGIGRDPLVEVNEIIQDLAADIENNWEDEDDETESD